jgi:NAD(P)-dependent dehydrogenase (short-subunit alcohol dehydrogenase family)
VEAEAGRIDVLFANAGGGSLLPLGAITEEQYEDTFGRNVKGVLFTVQKALPLLADGASVILTGSTAAAGGTPASASTPRRRPPCAPSRATGSST